MQVDDVKTFLVERLDAEADGSPYSVSEDVDLTALLSADAELVRVQNVRQFDFDGGIATLVTDESEYVVAADDIFGIELGSSRVQQGGGRPGFRRR